MKLFSKTTLLNVGLFFLIIFCSFSGASNTIDKVKLQLKWKHQFQFAGYYAAIEKGYYEEAGIAVELIEANNEKTPAQALKDGDVDFSIITTDIVLLRSKGYPLVVVASVFQHSPQILLATTKSGIQHVHDLIGRKVMMEPHSADLLAYLNNEGIALDQLDIVPHNFNVAMLVDEKVDAMSAYSTTETYNLQKQGINYITISPNAGGIDFYGDILSTTEHLAKKKPKLVSKFRAASLKGWAYAMQNEEEIIDLIKTKYNAKNSKEHLQFEANKMQHLIRPDIIELGYSNVGRWERIIEVYKQSNLLEEEVLIDGLFYTDYQKKKIAIPWKLIGLFLLIILFLGFNALFFFNLSNKLKGEMKQRKLLVRNLKTSKQELLKSNVKLVQLSQFKEDMTNMVIHDLKAPLSTIINAKDLGSTDETMDLIQHSGYKMLHLIQNSLDVYKYNQTKVELHYVKIDLVELINEALVGFEFLIRQKNLSITINNDIVCKLWVDDEVLGRVIVNLLSNAVKYSNVNGEIIISSNIDDDGIVSIKIKNFGPLIPDDKVKLIFEKYTQTDKRSQGGSTSTGLGLAYCKMAIEAHSGDVGVVSEPGFGVEFWLTLPLAACKGCDRCETIV